MAVNDIVPAVGDYYDETLAEASPDMLRTMIREMAQRMMDAEVEQVCGAGYGEVSPGRVNSRNGYRRREWDTRAGTIEVAIPRLRSGSYYPDWLQEHLDPKGVGVVIPTRDIIHTLALGATDFPESAGLADELLVSAVAAPTGRTP